MSFSRSSGLKDRQRRREEADVLTEFAAPLPRGETKG
jgi:hypothetical protein